MDESKHNKWDIIIKVISAFLTVGVIIVGIREYRENSALEFKKGFYETQLKQYTKLTDVAARISVISPDSIKTAAYLEYKRQFSTCYYGTVNMVSAPEVQSAMIGFQIGLEDFEKGKLDNKELQRLA